MYRSHSPAPSCTSTSDNEDDDYGKSAFFTTDACVVAPAQWSSRAHLLPHTADTLAHSPASRLPPEILIHILRNIHSSRDLYHALFVSRTWCECSVELLWHRPTFSKLSTLMKMMRVLSRDDQTFEYARFIRRLNFLSLGSELPDSLFCRLAQCVRLERLSLINCSAISDDGLTRVLPYCPNLVSLDLTGVSEVTDASIVALAMSTKKLQGINLGGCKKLTDISVIALAANCPLLRRVKLSNVELITDEAVLAIARSCPLLLEIDLNQCKMITDVSIREIWMNSTQMREMRLSHCVELTDAAFPASPRFESVANPGLNPFALTATDILPPLRVLRTFEQLRMLDLTACTQLTDDAIEGLVSVAPKIRNLVLAKCTQLTDRAVENICNLGRYLHYLHLGHAGGITDRSIRSLVRCCTRLRYIDLANCVQLTDMSVFELSSLPKLRRIGLVRVNNLTDQAVYALAERYSTLERIHLSYCDQITVMAVHNLLQRLPKLTHLSLTGIPAFRREELQNFCRDPPSEYNSTQRQQFCVYSGSGVAKLRTYLMSLFAQVADENEADETEYEDVTHRRTQHISHMDQPESAGENDSDEMVEAFIRHPNIVVSRGGFRTNTLLDHQIQNESPARATQPTFVVERDLTMTRDRGSHPTSRSGGNSTTSWLNSQQSVPSGSTWHNRRPRGFGQQPIIESSGSSSPTPSDVASDHSSGTIHSSGTGFFRTYAQASAPSASRNGVITPDLIFAEIGHGRGVGSGPGAVYAHGQSRRGPDPLLVGPSHSPYSSIPSGSTSYAMTNSFRLPVVDGDIRTDYPHDPRQILVDSSNSYQHSSGHSDPRGGWSAGQYEAASRSLSSSPTTRELQESIQSALGPQSGFFDGRESEGRGRCMKRSLRSTISAAEQYASQFFFGGRGSGSDRHEGPAGHAGGRDGDTHGY